MWEYVQSITHLNLLKSWRFKVELIKYVLDMFLKQQALDLLMAKRSWNFSPVLCIIWYIVKDHLLPLKAELSAFERYAGFLVWLLKTLKSAILRTTNKEQYKCQFELINETFSGTGLGFHKWPSKLQPKYPEMYSILGTLLEISQRPLIFKRVQGTRDLD